MPEDAKTQKYNMIFDWFDQNRDGYLTQDDMQQIAEVFISLPGGDRPENATPLREAFEQWWQLLLSSGDANADGRVGRDEFFAIMRSSVTASGNFESTIMRIADAFMRIVDTSGDGRLDFAEYVRMYEGLGVDPKHATEAFQRLDRDHSGKISYEEFRTAIREFYLSDDLNAPGSWLLGPMVESAAQSN